MSNKNSTSPAVSIRFANKGKDKNGYFTRYEIIYRNSQKKLSDYLAKKAIRRFLVSAYCKDRQIRAIRRIYQYPGFVATLTNDHRVIFTEVTILGPTS